MGWPEPEVPQRIILMIHDNEEELMSETETVIMPPARDRRLTEYVLLARGENDSWRQVATVSAVNGTEALRKHANTGGDPGMYVAVPVRSWKQRTVEMENAPKIKIS